MKDIYHSGAYLPLVFIVSILINDWSVCNGSILCLLGKWWITWSYAVFLFIVFLRHYKRVTREFRRYESISEEFDNLKIKTKEMISFSKLLESNGNVRDAINKEASTDEVFKMKYDEFLSSLHEIEIASNLDKAE